MALLDVKQKLTKEKHRGYLTFSGKNLKPVLYTLHIRQKESRSAGKIIHF